MNFAVYQSFASFVRILKPGSSVYLNAYSQGAEENETGYLLVTTDAGVEGGTVHALLIRLLQKPDDITVLVYAEKASEKVKAFLRSKRIKIFKGFLATAGLEDSLDNWRHTGGYSLEYLTQLIEHHDKKATVLSGRRRNQNNK